LLFLGLAKIAKVEKISFKYFLAQTKEFQA
jgi:hypothetical protein